MYLINNIDFKGLSKFEGRLRRAALINFVISLPFLLYFLIRLVTMTGFGVNAAGVVSMVQGKYLGNLLASPLTLVLLVAGLLLVIAGVIYAARSTGRAAIWMAGPGTILVGLAVFFTAGYNNTAFYPSKVDLQSSLTIYNASSSHYTLTIMTYVALLIPFVLAYIGHVWNAMDSRKLSADEMAYDDLY